MSSVPRAATMASRRPSRGNTDDAAGGRGTAHNATAAGPVLPRASTFRRASSAAVTHPAPTGGTSTTTATASASNATNSSDDFLPVNTPVQRAALPRAGTFKAVKSGPPSAALRAASGPAGPAQDADAAAAAGGADAAKASPAPRPARAALPRGHTFRAPRTEPMAGAALDMGDVAGASHAPGQRRSLPRAGTFAIGGGTSGPSQAELDLRKARETKTIASATAAAAANEADIFKRTPSDAQLDAKASCGMCGSCGGSGVKGMPPWAPERLAKLAPADREIVMRKLQAKEELGRLDRELREKQLSDRIAHEKREERSIQARADAAAAELAKNPTASVVGDADDDDDDDEFERAVSRVETALNSADIGDSEEFDDNEHTNSEKPGARHDGFSDESDDAEHSSSRVHKYPNPTSGSTDLSMLRTESAYLEDEVSQRRGRGRRQAAMNPSPSGPPAKSNPSVGHQHRHSDDRSDDTSAASPVDDYTPDSTVVLRDEKLQKTTAASPSLVTRAHTADENEDPGDMIGLRPSCDHDLGENDSAACSQCELLEEKVRDLEEQLEVLREVVALSNKNSQADEKDDSASSKKASWKSKVMSAYYGGGSSSSSSERARLKEEVEALRKATDFLFAKLQEADMRTTGTSARAQLN